MEWKHIDSFVKKRFQLQQSVKKVMLTVFWGIKGLITIDFFEKYTNVNNASYCQLLKQNSLFSLNDRCVGVCVCIYIYIYIYIYIVTWMPDYYFNDNPCKMFIKRVSMLNENCDIFCFHWDVQHILFHLKIYSNVECYFIQVKSV